MVDWRGCYSIRVVGYGGGGGGRGFGMVGFGIAPGSGRHERFAVEESGVLRGDRFLRGFCTS